MDKIDFSTTESNESPTSYKRIQIWTDGDTRKLLDLYSKYMSEIGPLKRFKTKKDMWAAISNQILEKTAKQCEERFKTVLRRKKFAVDNNKESGSKRIQVDFEEELTKINFMDDSIEPEIRLSSKECLKAGKCEIVKVVKPKTKIKTVQETLMEIAEKKEEAKERRHKEKMELLNKLLEEKETKN